MDDDTPGQIHFQSTAEVMNSAVRHIDSIMNWMTGEWNYIENNRARLAEVDRFLEMYGFFRDRVIAYDDARMDNEEKAWKLLGCYVYFICLANRHWGPSRFAEPWKGCLYFEK